MRSIRITELVEAIDELARGDRLPATDLERAREHPRVDSLHLTVDSGLDHPREHDVVIADDAHQDHAGAGERDECIQLPSFAEQLDGAAQAQR